MSEAAPGVDADRDIGTAAGAGSEDPGRIDAGARFALTSIEQERLASNLRKAVKRARRSGEQTLASITVALSPAVDPTEVACASRRPSEPWFVLEQPDRGHTALAGLGEATVLQAAGPQRFELLARRWRALSAAAAGRGRSPSAASPSRPTAAPRRTGRAMSRRRWSCRSLRCAAT